MDVPPVRSGRRGYAGLELVSGGAKERVQPRFNIINWSGSASSCGWFVRCTNLHSSLYHGRRWMLRSERSQASRCKYWGRKHWSGEWTPTRWTPGRRPTIASTLDSVPTSTQRRSLKLSDDKLPDLYFVWLKGSCCGTVIVSRAAPPNL